MLVTPTVNSDLSREESRVAVIDIGSNSVRMVVYEKNGVYPSPLFDERSICRLGEHLDKTGELSNDGINYALLTIRRFATLIHAMKVETVYPIATAAVRRASNSDKFTVKAEQMLRKSIKVLSKWEEATTVSRGLTLNIPEATGLVADLGGGSLELIDLKRGEILNSASFNFGHLSSVNAKSVSDAITSKKWIKKSKAKQLFGIGGSFRALGSAFFAREKYPLPVLHGTKISCRKVLSICNSLRKEEPDMTGIPLARQKNMPVAAEIICGLFETINVKRLVVSGTSIRDGVIATNVLNSQQQADFLLAMSKEICANNTRFEGLSDSLKVLLSPFLALNPSPEFARLVEIACNLADICWREHSDIRGDRAARTVLGLPVNCMTHKERVWLGLVLYHRYCGVKKNASRPLELEKLVSSQNRAHAVTIGLALRFALIFAAGTVDHLREIRFKLSTKLMTLTVSKTAQPLFDEACARRLSTLAESAQCKPEVVFA